MKNLFTKSVVLAILGLVGACVTEVDQPGTEAADPAQADVVVAPPPAPPGQMDLGQTCILGSILPGESCMPGLVCVQVQPNTRIGQCQLPPPVPQPAPGPGEAMVVD
jgi:hypothetical protein